MMKNIRGINNEEEIVKVISNLKITDEKSCKIYVDVYLMN